MLSVEHLKGSRTEQHVLTKQLTKQALMYQSQLGQSPTITKDI